MEHLSWRTYLPLINVGNGGNLIGPSYADALWTRPTLSFPLPLAWGPHLFQEECVQSPLRFTANDGSWLLMNNARDGQWSTLISKHTGTRQASAEASKEPELKIMSSFSCFKPHQEVASDLSQVLIPH